jgi:hypothetical protein
MDGVGAQAVMGKSFLEFKIKMQQQSEIFRARSSPLLACSAPKQQKQQHGTDALRCC